MNLERVRQSLEKNRSIYDEFRQRLRVSQKQFESGTYVDAQDPNHFVQVFFAQSIDALPFKIQKDIRGTYATLTFPVIGVGEWHREGKIFVSTRLTPMPNIMVGPDNYLYAAQNTCFFDSSGKTRRIETIRRLSRKPLSEEKLGKPGIPRAVQKVSFIPQEERVYMPLTQGNYEGIYGILEQIIKGRLALRYKP